MQLSHLPIGIFDSGLGGLTIVRAVQSSMPNESVIYFGDTAHLPYGDKSPELIRTYVADITRFLLHQPVKAIVIACNTASAVALQVVKNLAGNVPVYDVVLPAALHSLTMSTAGKIGVIATKTTINSGIYKQLLLTHTHQDIHIIEKATPLLVPMIEEGWLHNRVSQDVIDAYLSDTGFQNIDTLILGCTHYPLIKSQIEAYFAQNRSHHVHVIDSSIAVAEYVKEHLHKRDLLAPTNHQPSHQYFLSDFSQNFQDSAKMFLGKEIQFQKVGLGE